jgi:parallel beta-helix repeat protein
MSRNLQRKSRLRIESLEERTVPAIFQVTTIADMGTGSLRQALLDANNTPGADEIRFAIDTGNQTIAPISPLPTITDTVTIDGTTQPGYAGVPLIELTGIGAGAGVNSLTITATNCVVCGLVINGFGGSAILITGPTATRNVISGNYIGTDATGTIAVPNTTGVRIENGASNNTVGPAADLLVANYGGSNVTRYSTSFGEAIGPTLSGGGLAVATGFTVGPDGNYYVTSRGTGQILRYDGQTGAFIDVFATVSSFDIYDVLFTPDNHMLVASFYGNKILRFDGTTGAFIDDFITGNAPTSGGLNGPADILFGPDGVMYIASYSSSSVKKYDPITGEYLGEITTVNGPHGLAFDSLGRLYVSSYTTNVIARYNPTTGAFIDTFASGGSLIGPTDLEFGPDGLLYAANYEASTVSRFAPDGTDLGVFLTSEDGLNRSQFLHFVAGRTAGNVISGNTGSGILITGSGTNGNVVSGNYIGTDATGTLAIGNWTGVRIDKGASHNTIGASTSALSTSAMGNVISGQTGVFSWERAGVLIQDSGTTENVVTGNRIGTSADGTASLGNTFGVLLSGGTIGYAINGTTDHNTISNNLISGNSWAGVALYHTNENAISGNYIGTNAAGNITIPNQRGIHLLDRADKTMIRGNVISGNAESGIWAGFEPGVGPDGTTISGNRIGTTADGTSPLGNGGDGISLATWVTNTLIGGTTPTERNIISDNGRHGVAGNETTVVQGNYIGTDVTGLVRMTNGVNQYGSSRAVSAGIVGGLTAVPGTGAGNVIYSGEYAIDGTIVQGNLVGLGADGKTVLGVGAGISVGTHGLVGGSDPTARNVIAGWSYGSYGITAASDSVVQGNYVGTDMNGIALPELFYGTAIVVNGSNVLIGGAVPGAGNIICGVGETGHGQAGIGVINSNAIIQGNRIGVDVAGTAMGTGNGIVIWGNANNTLIGGSNPGEGNLISGNNSGIALRNNPDGTVIRGNLIGTTADGTAARGNHVGIDISTSRNTTIGGPNPKDRNIISGNNWGVWIQDYVYADIVITGLSIQGNFIGTDVTGTYAVSNDIGVVLLNKNNTLGGTTPGAGNLISGNTQTGVHVGPLGLATGIEPAISAANNAIIGNIIGTDVTGTLPLGNSTGIYISATIGTSVSNNIIRGNSGNGITAPNTYWYYNDAYDSWGIIVGNQFRANSIGDNGGLGIDLGNDGATPNDPLDADVGANGLQNSPIITGATGGATTTVSGTLHSKPNTTFILDFYANSTNDLEGERYLGAISVTTDGSGNATFDATSLGATVDGEVITATATGDEGTSEFSGISTPVTVVYNQPPTANSGGPYTTVEGGSITLSGSGNDPDNDSLTYEWDLDNDGQFDDATGPTPTFSAIGLDGYAWSKATVHLRVTDASGLAAISTATINLMNASPVPAINSISNVRLEGTAVQVVGSAIDPAGLLDTLTFAWAVYKDGATTAYTIGGNNTTFSFTPPDNGTYRIALTVSDEDGGSTTTEQTITVTNVAPTASITAPASGQQGVGLAFASVVSDPSSTDTAVGFTYMWLVTRNGSLISLTGVPTTGALFSFVPTESGTYSVILTVTDKDGGATTVTRTVVVAAAPGVTKFPDGRLVIVGTNGDDDIKVNPGGGAPEIKVNFNGVQTTYLGVTDIIVYANAGNDRVQIAGGTTVPVVAFGGAGDDRLKAGGGPSILVGGGGDDTLLGGSGEMC